MKIDLNELLRRGVRAHEAGDLLAAAAAYEQILSIAPEHADALHLSGLIAFQSDDGARALGLIRSAIAIDGGVPLYHANLGRVLMQMGDAPGAVGAFRDAVQLEPQSAALHADLASALIRAEDYDGARSRCHLALELDPSLAEAHLNLGLALQELKSPGDEEAVASLERAVLFNPSLAGAHLALGVAMQEGGDQDRAASCYIQALSLNPEFVEAHCNLGNLKREACDFSAATGHYRQALDIDPDRAEVWGNLGVALQEQGCLDEAIATYDEGIRLAPEDPEIRRNRGMALLAVGRFEEGWADYDYRWRTARFRPLIRDFGVPRWDGSDPRGLRILVHAEQGLGDTIQFSRFLLLLANMGAAVTFECPQTLLPVMQRFSEHVDVIAVGSPLPKIDAHIPLLSLPGLLDITASTIPPCADLVPSQDKLSEWEGRAASWPDAMKIGIAWRGNPDHVRDAVRSPGLEPFLRLLDVEGVTLVSLQKENAADELTRLPGAHRIIDPTEYINDFGDTAALTVHLDMIVACDSAPLHLAGALGCNTIAVLPHVAEWRWGTKGERTPWYPAVRLVRQPAFGDWTGTFDQVLELIR